MLGLRKGTIELDSDHQNWAKEFAQEKARLLANLPGEVVAIEHIGNTVIPDLPAKPIIDLIVAIPSLEESDE